MATLSASWVPSNSQVSQIMCQVANFPDFQSAHISVGTAASQPGTYGALTSPEDHNLWFDCGPSVQIGPGVASIAGVIAVGTRGAVGLLAWVLLFHGTGIPAGGAVPLAVAGPFTVQV